MQCHKHSNLTSHGTACLKLLRASGAQVMKAQQSVPPFTPSRVSSAVQFSTQRCALTLYDHAQ